MEDIPIEYFTIGVLGIWQNPHSFEDKLQKIKKTIVTPAPNLVIVCGAGL